MSSSRITPFWYHLQVDLSICARLMSDLCLLNGGAQTTSSISSRSTNSKSTCDFHGTLASFGKRYWTLVRLWRFLTSSSWYETLTCLICGTGSGSESNFRCHRSCSRQLSLVLAALSSSMGSQSEYPLSTILGQIVIERNYSTRTIFWISMGSFRNESEVCYDSSWSWSNADTGVSGLQNGSFASGNIVTMSRFKYRTNEVCQ